MIGYIITWGTKEYNLVVTEQKDNIIKGYFVNIQRIIDIEPYTVNEDPNNVKIITNIFRIEN